MDPGLPQLRMRIRHRVRSDVHYHKANRSLWFDGSQKVWVGGITDDFTWQQLQQIADSVGKSKWVHIIGNGNGIICYGTAEEAQTAISTLNSIATLNGYGLHFDVWTTKEKA